jgi:hypothetical protein
MAAAVIVPVVAPAAHASAPEARQVLRAVAIPHAATPAPAARTAAPVVTVKKVTAAPAVGNGPVRLVFGHKVG